MATAGQVVVLVVTALAAGVVDAIAGGGGLLTIPVLLAVGLPPHLALGTNKGQSVFGSTAALLRFARAGLVSLPRARLTIPLGFAGALLGATLVLRVDAAVLRPLVLALLLGAAVFLVAVRPHARAAAVTAGAGVRAGLLALGAGAYDGFFGPGTGTFLVVGFAGLLALPLRQASAEAKAVNAASNLAALLLFAFRGAVLWRLALPMALGQLVGGWLGAHLAIHGGDRLVRLVLLTVVSALVVKLAGNWLGLW
ncbi:MAG: TSUP family transporter [Myxococcaceae bacterium]